jgi:hypothetical protein
MRAPQEGPDRNREKKKQPQQPEPDRSGGADHECRDYRRQLPGLSNLGWPPGKARGPHVALALYRFGLDILVSNSVLIDDFGWCHLKS